MTSLKSDSSSWKAWLTQRTLTCSCSHRSANTYSKVSTMKIKLRNRESQDSVTLSTSKTITKKRWKEPSLTYVRTRVELKRKAKLRQSQSCRGRPGLRIRWPKKNTTHSSSTKWKTAGLQPKTSNAWTRLLNQNWWGSRSKCNLMRVHRRLISSSIKWLSRALLRRSSAIQC